MGALLAICTGQKEEKGKDQANSVFSSYENGSVSLYRYGDNEQQNGGRRMMMMGDGMIGDSIENDDMYEDEHGYVDVHRYNDEEEDEIERRQLEEQTRLEALVVDASRSMIVVQSRTGFGLGNPAGVGGMMSGGYDDGAQQSNYIAAVTNEFIQSRLLSDVRLDPPIICSYAKAVTNGTTRQHDDAKIFSPYSAGGKGMFEGAIPQTSLSPQSVMDVLSKDQWEYIDLSSLENSSKETTARNQRQLSRSKYSSNDLYFDECAESFLSSVLPYSLFKGSKPIVENL